VSEDKIIREMYTCGNFPDVISLAIGKILIDKLNFKFIKEINNTVKVKFDFKLPHYLLISNFWKNDLAEFVIPIILDNFKTEVSETFDIYLYKCNVEIDTFNNTSTVFIEYIRDLK